MSADIKYSVIIPVYNSEKTLARCLGSLVCQNRKDIQIIAVNDGSTDKTERIIQELAAAHPVIAYIYQENGGVSRARNTGLAHAEGEYVTFLDSDDYVAENYFETLDRAEDCDLLVFAHEAVGGAPLDEGALFARLQALETPDQKLSLLLASRKIMSPWNKRFRRSLIEQHSIRFIEGLSVGEDFNFCTAYTMHCRSIGICAEKIIFNDLSGEASLSRRYRPHLDDQLATVFAHIKDTVSENTLYSDHTAALLAQVDYLYVKHVFSCISEEFRGPGLQYFRDRRRIVSICEKFRQPMSDRRCNLVHRGLRLALKWRIYWPFYLVSWLVKGRKYHS